MAAPRLAYTKWVSVGLTREMEADLGKYIRDNKKGVHGEGDTLRELISASLVDDTAQHNIVLSNLLKEALTLKTREQVLDWERRMEEAVLW